MEIEEIQRTIDKEDKNGVDLMKAEEVELNEIAQHQETEIRQEEGFDEVDEELELDEEKRYILEILKKKMEMSEKLEPVYLKYEDRKKEGKHKNS